MLDTIVETPYTGRKGLSRVSLKRKPGTGLKRKPKTVQKRIKPPKKKKFKVTKTLLRKADTSFSEKIRTRDGRCLFPGCKVETYGMLQNSHYIGRARWATRFDPDNCISLCWLHHFKDKMLGYEYQKQRKEVHGWDGQYTLFMKEWLGEDRFLALIERSESGIKRADAIKTWIETGDKPPLDKEEMIR